MDNFNSFEKKGPFYEKFGFYEMNRHLLFILNNKIISVGKFFFLKLSTYWQVWRRTITKSKIWYFFEKTYKSVELCTLSFFFPCMRKFARTFFVLSPIKSKFLANVFSDFVADKLTVGTGIVFPVLFFVKLVIRLDIDFISFC